MEINIQNNNNERRGRMGIKLAIIGALCILLLIPWAFIRSMIDERNSTEVAAESEVYEKWGFAQVVKGPSVKVYGTKDEPSFSLLPETLDIKGDVRTRTLSRGIYDFTVYDADLTLTGTFLLPPTLDDERRALLARGGWSMTLDLTSLKGLTDNPVITVGGRTLTPQEVSNEGSRLMWEVDLDSLLAGDGLDYEIRLALRGSRGLDFAPMGNTTTVCLHSDCATPSFGGAFLPAERSVNSDGFDALWRVLALNRSFSQIVPRGDWGDVGESTFGVELRRPVEQYLQNERAVKYAFLVVLLTFAVVFFVETRRERPIHPVQYLLIGIAIMLFYTLLLSFSEHLSFTVAYVIASVMTAVMIALYLGSIMRDRKVGLLLGGLLAGLYAFIFVLLQIESYALLVGSVALFALLAVAMSASRKIDWYRK
jgi:inner membrane protein